jgi:hypothetical protein
MTTTLTPDTNELRKISELPTESALRRAAAFLAHLVKDPAFLGSQVLPLIEEARDREDWHVARRHDAEDGAFSLQVFVWPPGTGTRIHDHSSWGGLLLRRWHRARRALRSPRRRLPSRACPPEEGLAIVVEQRGRSLDGAARRRGHPPGRKPGRESGDLGSPLRAADGRGGRSGLRPFPRPRLRPDGLHEDARKLVLNEARCRRRTT